jgi:hypothetical protein
MKKLATLLTGGAIAACALAPTAQAYPGYYNTDAAAHITVVRDKLTEFAYFNDDWLIREGSGICVMLRQGYSHEYVWAGVRIDAGLPYSTSADAGLTGAAIGTWCPEQAVAPLPPSTPPQLDYAV